tara:strand:- start:720 stop:860 length:141 start_codon:yes stop_codon:yes gene_type:complete
MAVNFDNYFAKVDLSPTLKVKYCSAKITKACVNQDTGFMIFLLRLV